MATVELILLQRVEKLGQMGELVRVKPGYARNFLLPQKKAIRANKDNLAKFELQRAQLEALNIKRREVYAAKAQAQRATLEEYAITAGCLAIARTEPGEKYMAPDGTWQTRTAAPPIRSPKCP